jgi:hypothetical protein
MNIITLDEEKLIDDIETLKNTIKKRVKFVDCTRFRGQNFGNENEYTCKSLFDELNVLLEDVTTLTKLRKQFSKLSTDKEKTDIINALKSLNHNQVIFQNPKNFQHADSANLMNLAQSINKLKQTIRKT